MVRVFAVVLTPTPGVTTAGNAAFTPQCTGGIHAPSKNITSTPTDPGAPPAAPATETNVDHPAGESFVRQAFSIRKPKVVL